jgi:hypothetical protein
MTGPADLPLRDIHLPPDPPWWPPAPGWWALLFCVLAAAAALLLLRARRRRRLRSALHLAKSELARLRATPHPDPQRQVQEISVLMRRAAISLYPRRETAALTGDDWLSFLDGILEDAPFRRGPGRILADAPYRPAVQPEEIAPLLDLCGQWLEAAARATAVRR